MRNYFLIGIGGILGAISRYLFERVHIYQYHGNIPLNTLLINISGSFLLAVVLTIAFEIWRFDPGIRLAITTGFLGAYTTFSTFCKETVGLLHQGDYFSAASYVIASVVFGLAAAYLGVIFAREAVSRLLRKEITDPEIIEADAEGEAE